MRLANFINWVGWQGRLEIFRLKCPIIVFGLLLVANKKARSKGSIFWNDEFYFSLLEGAATLGDLETMKWAINENTGTTGTAANHASDLFVPVIEAAASGGHIHILEYLRPANNMEVFYSKLTGVAENSFPEL